MGAAVRRTDGACAASAASSARRCAASLMRRSTWEAASWRVSGSQSHRQSTATSPANVGSVAASAETTKRRP
jgi:hypothetical protein